MNKNNRDTHYYKRVYLGCVRAVDFLYSLPEFDGNTVGVTGGSQGGALSIVTAGLDPRIKFLAAFYPALCDYAGYLHKRAGGWPHYSRNAQTVANDVETLASFDVVNFARRVNAPGWYSWGYNDVTCPPTSMYSAYNVIPGVKMCIRDRQTDVWFIWFRNVPIWGSAVAGTWVCIIRLVASLPSSSIATMYIAVLIRCRRSLMLFMNRTARWLSEPIG